MQWRHRRPLAHPRHWHMLIAMPQHAIRATHSSHSPSATLMACHFVFILRASTGRNGRLFPLQFLLLFSCSCFPLISSLLPQLLFGLVCAYFAGIGGHSNGHSRHYENGDNSSAKGTEDCGRWRRPTDLSAFQKPETKRPLRTTDRWLAASHSATYGIQPRPPPTRDR